MRSKQPKGGAKKPAAKGKATSKAKAAKPAAKAGAKSKAKATTKRSGPLVRYEQVGRVAIVTMNRPEYRNAQNAKLTFAMDAAFQRAVDDDSVGCIVLAGAGDHFSAGHDIGTPGRDIMNPFGRVATQWYSHADRSGVEPTYVREAELYVGMCRRWRALPKPTIAMVQGACVAGGLMLAWSCDLIVASDDAFFADPVLKMGIPGVEYFAHPHAVNPRMAKEMLFTGGRFDADWAHRAGMINRVVARDALRDETLALAERVASMPRFGTALAKQMLNAAEDRQGLADNVTMAYGFHHAAHAHNELTDTDYLAGQNPKTMAKGLREGAKGAKPAAKRKPAAKKPAAKKGKR